jgi:hypothetical protein
LRRQQTSDYHNTLIYVGLDFCFSQSQYVPAATFQVFVFSLISCLLFFVTVPVVAITFNDELVGRERNINNVWGDLVLTFGRIAFFYKSGNHGRFEAACSGVSFLSEKSIAAPGT